MMNNALYVGLAGLGGYLAYEHFASDDAARPPSVPMTTSKNAFSSTQGATLTPLTSNVKLASARAAAASFAGVPRSKLLFGTPLSVGNASKVSKDTSGALQQQLDKATAELKKDYDKLTESARKAGAAKLNDILSPSPGLTGKESWSDASKKIASSLGAIGGGAVCGPACAALGAMAGAYLGKKLGPILGEQWNNLESWVSNAYDTVGDKVKSGASNAASAVKDFIGDLF